ncbi:O-antigen polymerase [Alkalihalobacillus sp. BA299]|uniref:O-antigen polymerase n=1 Tax=Alkalihalobacillus sp. BA299 TaxID=2815938 RepID=UPI001ADA6B1E|nr:O-antigen polymerase [Alkalihalobacillus sp. BA299]
MQGRIQGHYQNHLVSNYHWEVKKSHLTFILINVFVGMIILFFPLIGGEITVLTISGWIFFVIAIMPIFLTGFNWTHPLCLNMPFIAIQAISIIFSGSGIIPLENYYLWYLDENTVQELYIKTVAINCLGLLVMYFFSFYKTNDNKSLTPTKFYIKKNSYTVSILFILIMLVAFIFIILNVGSISYMFNNIARRVDLYSGLAYFIVLLKYGTVAALLLLIKRKKKIAIFMVFFQIFLGVILGDRGYIIFSTLLPLLVFYNYYYKKVNLKKLTLIGLILVIFYQIYGEFRLLGEVSAESEPFFTRVVNVIEDVRHDDITAASIYVVDADESKLLLGRPLINLFLAPIPRGIYENKPIIAESAIVGELVLGGGQGYGLPPGIFGYGYLNFKWIGVIIFAAISGLTVRFFYEKLVGFYKNRKIKIPEGNIVVYSMLCLYVTNPLSTEIQIKVLTQLPAIIIIWFFCSKINKKAISIKK